jgi:hypothetical protein
MRTYLELQIENINGRGYSAETGFFTALVTEEEFIDYLETVDYKPNSTPRKTEKFLELRMYTLVPYNIMAIQKGIQHEHSVVENVVKFILDQDEPDQRFVNWAREWKTSILLNGGTSNEGHWIRHGFREIFYVGTMQKHLQTLQANNIPVAFFKEPDLNSMLTGISFIVDERVFLRDIYPDYVETPKTWDMALIKNGLVPEKEIKKWEEENKKHYEAWKEKIGGEQNAFLREFLRDKKLA